MFRRWLQAADCVFDDGRLEIPKFGARFSDHPLGERRSRGDRSRAAADLVTGFDDAIVFETGEQAHHISARRIRNVDTHSRSGKLARIARIAKVIEQPLAVHSCFNYRVDVVAAVIERNGKILICQRKGGRHSLKWEFPGGKVERGETPAEALRRELREELGIEAQIGPEMNRHQFRYGKGPLIRLYFFRVTEFTPEPVNLQFEKITWENRRRLPDYDFLEGDVDFVRRLANE